MKLQLKKKHIKDLNAKNLNAQQTKQIGAGRGATFNSRIDCNSYYICDTHPAICQSIGLCPSIDMCA
ncbi:hypothetical protein [Pseudoalteromonas umbrosa]|uniref:hypothetical protein n=1 Tax=Pseudoalteromonas umbrosa TaxID=3048489 RepID=UPI0024C42773|nr:hypothetical protein [Pseudoalteromonas sp. B95]MDK1288968.1 hypothetical protein [Pseudoalteromonas sp. B95]